MARLVIGKESVEMKWVKGNALSNLRILHARIQSLDHNSDEYARMHGFYTRKMEEQTAILEWLHRHEGGSQGKAISEMQDAG